MTTTTTPDITEKRVIKPWRHDLTTDEKAGVGLKLAQRQSEKDDLENERKQIATDYKARIESHDTEISRLARLIQNGWELRPRSVIERLDYSRGTYELVAEDGEVLEQRPMNEFERQRKIDVQEGAGDE
jgi:hypothetical protein